MKRLLRIRRDRRRRSDVVRLPKSHESNIYQRDANFVDEVKKQYYEALRSDDTDLEPISEIETSSKGQLLKAAANFVAYSDVESRNKHLSNFASDKDVTNQLDIIIDNLHRGLRTHFRISGYIELVGSCVDESKVGRICEIDSLYVLNENFKFKQGQKENTYELYSVDGHPHDPLDLIAEFASAIEKCMEECSTTAKSIMRHGGFNTPHFSGVRYNGPAVTILLTYPEGKIEDERHIQYKGSKNDESLTETFQHLEAKRMIISIDVTLAFKVSADSDVVSQIRSKVNKVQDVLYRKMITKTDIHFIPRPQHDCWCLTTARLEARLLSCLPTESYVKQAYCYAKLLNKNIVFPEIVKTEFQERISEKLLDLESDSISNRDQMVKDWQEMMRYTHTFLSDADAEKCSEDTKRDISLNNAALKHMLLTEALQSPSFFQETPSQQPFDIVLKVFKSIGQLRRSYVPHAFIDGANISVFSLTKSAMLSKEQSQLKLDTKQLCMEICKVFEENEDFDADEDLRHIRSQLLISASEWGHTHMVNTLLNYKGTEINAENGDGHSAVYTSCLGGFLDVASMLHKKGAKLNQTKQLPLNGAALNGHRSLVEWLIGQGADVNGEDKDGYTSLANACQNGFLELAKYLHSKGADVNQGGALPLGRAALGGHTAVLDWLLEEGADVNGVNQYGFTAIANACGKGFLELAQCLHSRGANVNHGGQLPLGCAAFGGHQALVEWLVENGADVDGIDKDGYTALALGCDEGFLELSQCLHSHGANVNRGGRLPLGRAARGGHKAVVEWLVENGAVINGADEDGFTALTSACGEGFLELAQYLHSRGANVNHGGNLPLVHAAFGGHTAVVEWLVENGADINAVNEGGWTALTVGCEKGFLEVAQYLHSRGAKVNQGGILPLGQAALGGHTAVVKWLVGKGADVNAPDEKRFTALSMSCHGGFLELAQYLHSLGANVNHGGELPLWHAALSGDKSVIEWLVEKGANINAEDQDGETALYAACQEGKLEVAKKLFNLNAEIELGDMKPLSVAAYKGHSDVVTWLLDQGAELETENKYGATALYYACISGNIEVAKYLTSRGADVNHGALKPLGGAAGYVRPAIVKWLINEKGASINATDKDGDTHLHNICQTGHLDVLDGRVVKDGMRTYLGGNKTLGYMEHGDHVYIVECLLDNGIDVNAENHLGLTALYYSCKSGYLEVARQLVTHGADIDRGNCTPLMGAASSGHLDSTQWLIERGADASLKEASGQIALQSVRNKIEQLGDDAAALKLREKLFEVEKLLMITRE